MSPKGHPSGQEGPGSEQNEQTTHRTVPRTLDTGGFTESARLLAVSISGTTLQPVNLKGVEQGSLTDAGDDCKSDPSSKVTSAGIGASRPPSACPPVGHTKSTGVPEGVWRDRDGQSNRRRAEMMRTRCLA